MNYPRIPKLQLPATVPFMGHKSFSGVCTATARNLWFSLHQGFHRSAVSLSTLNFYSMIQTIAPVWVGALLHFLHRLRSKPTNTPVCLFVCLFVFFSPSSFIQLSFAWFYIFVSTFQVLLSAFWWCSDYSSVSEGVCLMYPWWDVLHIHLQLHHLVLSSHKCFRTQNPQW